MRATITGLAVWTGLLLLCATGRGNLYYVGYEGDTLPENQPGWTRVTHDETGYGNGGAERWIETDDTGNSYLVIDSLRSSWIADYAEYSGQLDPASGEHFYAEWRLEVVQHYGGPDHGVSVMADNGGNPGLHYTDTYLTSMTDPWVYYMNTGGLHTYRLESDDMVRFQLWIDGAWAHDGDFWDAVIYYLLEFGDCGWGNDACTRARTRWDHFRCGVVPEPNADILPLAGSMRNTWL